MQYSAVKYRKFSSRRKFGVEMEVSERIPKALVKRIVEDASRRRTCVTKYQLSVNNNYWHIKDDATCGSQGRDGPKGVEVASFVGQGIADLQHITEVAWRLEDAGCEVNQNCGLHIHADASDLSIAQVGTILAHWVKIENMFALSLPDHRRNNEYCSFMQDRCHRRLLRDHAYTPLQLYDTLRPENLGYYENADRRVTLNIVNYARALAYKWESRKTLELRWPEGTLDATDIKCWVRLFLNFIEFVKDRPMPDDLHPVSLYQTLYYLGLMHEPTEFVIFSEGLHETKTWLLERFAYFGEEYATVFRGANTILNSMWSPVRKYA
jgi:hypothetical protein